MVGITEASAALGGIKAAVDMVKGITALKSESDINQAVIAIQRILLDAQASALADGEKQSEQQARIADLERRLSSIEQWENEKSRYDLTEFPTGKFAYVLKQTDERGEPSHRLCVSCYDRESKSVLQVKRRHGGGESVYCPICKDTMVLSEFPPIQNIDREDFAGPHDWMAR